MKLSETVELFTDQKDRMEAENQSLVLSFGSQLDQSLKGLHKTILGSVSQQQQQLRCMEEHAQSFLASKCDVRDQNCLLLFLLFLIIIFDYQIISMIIDHKMIDRQHISWNQGLRKCQRHVLQA